VFSFGYIAAGPEDRKLNDGKTLGEIGERISNESSFKMATSSKIKGLKSLLTLLARFCSISGP